jgi:putative transposase
VGASQDRRAAAHRRLPGVQLDRGTRLAPPRVAVAAWVPRRPQVLGGNPPPGLRRPADGAEVWQTDFSEFETAAGGIWRICAVIDYATKYCLAATVTPTARGQDALACLAAAVQHAEHLLQLEDLRSDRGEVDLVDETTGELLRTIPARIAVVSDNGPCFRSGVFAESFTGEDPCCATSAPESRARRPTASSSGSSALSSTSTSTADPSTTATPSPSKSPVRQSYNTIRPHQALHDRTPRDAYLAGR